MPTSTILLVDDHKELLVLLQKRLVKEGFQVETAEDGEEAVELALQVTPQLVISDVQLPRKDGREVCRIIKDLLQIPVIMMSGGGAEFEASCLAAGADAYLFKPFGYNELRQILFNFLPDENALEVNQEELLSQ